MVFFGCPNSYGHTNPTLGLVKELVFHGERVFYYNTLKFKDAITKAGATFCEYPFETKIMEFSRKKTGSVMNITVEDIIDQLTRVYLMSTRRSRGYENILLKQIEGMDVDYIIFDESAGWGKNIAHRIKVPSICSITKFAYCDSILHKYGDTILQNILQVPKSVVPCEKSKSIFFDKLNRALNRFGTQTDKSSLHNFFSGYSDLNIIYTSKKFQICADKFDSSYQFIGPSLTSRGHDTSQPHIFNQQAPFIFVTLGTSSSSIDFYYTCVKAFANKEYNVLISLGGLHQTKMFQALPKNIKINNYVNQIEVLSKADAFIFHGGMNSVNEALSFAVPLIVCPQRGDQFLVAERIEELGVGLKMDINNITSENLYSSVKKLLENQAIKKNCERVQRSLKRSGGNKRGAKIILNFKNRNNQ